MSKYSDSIQLPKTNFQMRANLNSTEVQWINFWKKEKVFDQLKSQNKHLKKFILHDGPPYANGHLHLGHALNKILKDIICRSYFKLSYDVDFTPGWDCHGLPIEWEVEESYRKKKISKSDVGIIEFREACREFAKKWIEVQCQEFIRLGLDYDWENKYTTMKKESEATIVSELLKFLEKGDLYLGRKPVMWSVVEKTALAEAEIEYREKKSKSIFVKFPILKFSDKNFKNSSIVIWTTTPWTIPGNQAVAYSENIQYVLIMIKKDYPELNLLKNEKLIFSKKLVDQAFGEINIKSYEVLNTLNSASLKDIICKHPLNKLGYDYKVPLIPGDHVTNENGSGFVHIAPGHGVEDFDLGQKFNLSIPKTIKNNGLFNEDIPLFNNIHVYKADEVVINKLSENKNLIKASDFFHSYPHSWRSKAPLIYRTTSQWFISMDKNCLRDTAMREIEKVKWIPTMSKNRISSMVSERPDWCISRQRSWGVPITIFLNKKTLKPIIDKNLNKRIVEIIKKKGCDAWFLEPKEFFLGNDYDSDDYEKVNDILDVWFDSGSSHVFVLKNKGIFDKSDLYLEGSDQHRGWFQSSLIQSCAIYDESPYKSVLTHGFVLDEKGKKMSKSQKNVISPSEIIEKYGADVLRLWVASSDYSDDLKISFESLERQSENYRKIRNTIRFLLGNLNNWNKNETAQHHELPELERYIRHRLVTINNLVIENFKSFNFFKAIKEIINFCNYDLSALFFDIRKDVLYCDSIKSKKRQCTRTVLVDIFYYLISWISPVLVFTSEEAWQCWRSDIIKEKETSCHLKNFFESSSSWEDFDLEKKWKTLLQIRSAVTQAFEKKRKEKIFKSSLESKLTLCLQSDDLIKSTQNIALDEFFIVSSVDIEKKKDKSYSKDSSINNLFLKIDRVDGLKCERCWKYYPKKNILENVCMRCRNAHENNSV